MNVFGIDYAKLLQLLAPIALRTAIGLAWLGVLVEPIKTLYNAFLAKRTTNWLYASTTSQVVSLERLLNTLFDAELRRIFISEADERELAFVYEPDDVRALYVYEVDDADAKFVFNVDGVAWDFVVNIPAAAAINQTDLRNILNRFKLPSKNYIIITY